MTINWRKADYFVSLIKAQDLRKSHAAIELLIDDLHSDKNATILHLLSYCGSEDVLWGIVHLLASENQRVSGNAAYVLGTFAENYQGRERLASLVTGSSSECTRILPDFLRLFSVEDNETVMNAVGALGTLAESDTARMWMISDGCFGDLLGCMTRLLAASDVWASSNAALLLARLLISEQGAVKLLSHPQSDKILCDLINSLGTDEAGCGMNAAFAIGRLCDMEAGVARLLTLPICDTMITKLIQMLFAVNISACKNSCFALSCLAISEIGSTQLLNSRSCADMLEAIGNLLSSDDTEASWFAAMTLKTFAKQPKGCRRLRNSEHILLILQSVEKRPNISNDLRDEVCLTLELLKPLHRPWQLTANVLGPEQVEIKWQEVTTKLNMPISYQVFAGSRCLYEGSSCECVVGGLTPYTEYNIHAVALTELERSLPSESISFVTSESVPSPPTHLQVEASSSRQIKISWQPPEEPRGVIRGYFVYLGSNLIEQTNDSSAIISGLHPGTSYDLSVCASTAVGEGEHTSIIASTTKLGMHAPAKPDVSVRGRCELHVTWHPPVAPIGRTTRYDLSMDGEVIYSGTDLYHTVHRLKPDTEYTFTVSVITSEGRFESKPAKKKTTKDEFEVDRVPLYRSMKQISEAAILPEGDPLKSLETNVFPASLESFVLTEGPKEITETVPSNNPSVTSRSNEVKLVRRKFAWEANRRTQKQHQELIETFTLVGNVAKGVQKLHGHKSSNVSSGRPASIFNASVQQSPSVATRRDTRLMSRSKSDVVHASPSSSMSSLGLQFARSRPPSNLLSSSFFPSRVKNDFLTTQPNNPDALVEATTNGVESSVASATGNSDGPAQNDTASGAADMNSSDAATGLTEASDDKQSSVSQNVGSRGTPNSATTTTVLSHQVLTFDSVASTARSTIQREKSVLLRIALAKRLDDSISGRRAGIDRRRSRDDSTAKISTQLFSFPAGDDSHLNVPFRRVHTMSTPSFSRAGTQMWRQATMASASSGKQVYQPTRYGLHNERSSSGQVVQMNVSRVGNSSHSDSSRPSFSLVT